MTILLLLLIGLGAGILSGLLGIGGGIIIVPLLVYVMKMTQQQAQATSLAALVSPFFAGVGAYVYYKKGDLEIMPAVYVAVGMTAGAFFGAQFASHVDGVTLRRAFAVLMVIMAVRMWI